MVCLSFEMEQNVKQWIGATYTQMYNFRIYYDTGITGITCKNVKYTANKWEVNKQHSGEYEEYLVESVRPFLAVRCIW